MKELLIHDKEYRYSIKFTWEEDKEDIEERPYWVNFKGLAIISYLEDFSELYYNQEEQTDFDKAIEDDTYMFQGFIKWDGCMEIHEFNHHFCEYDNMMQRIVQDIYLSALLIMGDRFESNLSKITLLNKEV